MVLEAAPTCIINYEKKAPWHSLNGKEVFDAVVDSLTPYQYIDWGYVRHIVLPGPNRHTSQYVLTDAGDRIRSGVRTGNFSEDSPEVSYMGISTVNRIASSRYRQIIDRGWNTTRLEQELDLLYSLQREMESQFLDTYYYPVALQALATLPPYAVDARKKIFTTYQKGEKTVLIPLIRKTQREIAE